MRSTNRRRGRPRKEPHGPDRGTPEARRKRRELVGSGNPSLAAYPLGVLLARGHISQAQHDAGSRYAGCRYAWLRGRALGSTTTRGMFKLIFPSGPIPDTTQAVQASVEYRWREASEALAGEGGRRPRRRLSKASPLAEHPKRLSGPACATRRYAGTRAPDRRSPRFGSTFSYRLTISGGSGGGSQRSQ